MTRSVSLLSVLCALSLSACEDKVSEAQIPEGTFAPSSAYDDVSGTEVDVSLLGDVAVEVDRDALTVTILHEDGSVETVGLVERDREAWLGGCATMDSHVEIEAADLDVESLTIGAVLIDQPMISTSCSGTRLLLGAAADDGDFSGPVYLFEATAG